MKVLTSQEIAEAIKIGNPLTPPIRETQPFGANYLDIYARMGFRGHNGTDWGVEVGTSVMSVCCGTVTFSGENPGYGLMVEIETDPMMFDSVRFKLRFIYGHLKDAAVKTGDIVQGGELLAHSGNSGVSTGPHLHLGCYPYYQVERNIWVRDHGNGYGGAIDLQPLYWNQDWNAMPVTLRYGEAQDWKREFTWRIRHGTWAYYKLKRLPTQDEVNGFVYGFWPVEVILDPAMATVWYACSKPAFDMGRCKSPYHL